MSQACIAVICVSEHAACPPTPPAVVHRMNLRVCLASCHLCPMDAALGGLPYPPMVINQRYEAERLCSSCVCVCGCVSHGQPWEGCLPNLKWLRGLEHLNLLNSCIRAARQGTSAVLSPHRFICTLHSFVKLSSDFLVSLSSSRGSFGSVA